MVAVWTQWSVFAIFAFISVAGALGMSTTMSMFRSGIFLMASFIGVAGLFILLLADLLALLQVMMYIGGMLVMILFMVMFSHDPGGAMMAGMKMSLIESFFSRGIPEHKMEDMDMQEMSMTTPIKRLAAALSAVIGLILGALIVFRPAWPLAHELPATDSAAKIGNLLMGKYMMAFEGAGLLILIGIFGAVLLARPGRFPDRAGRGRAVAVDETPAPIEEDQLHPREAAREPLPLAGAEHAHSDDKGEKG